MNPALHIMPRTTRLLAVSLVSHMLATSALAGEPPSLRAATPAAEHPTPSFERFTRDAGVDPANLGAVLGGESRRTSSDLRFSEVFCPLHQTFEPALKMGERPTFRPPGKIAETPPGESQP